MAGKEMEEFSYFGYHRLSSIPATLTEYIVFT